MFENDQYIDLAMSFWARDGFEVGVKSSVIAIWTMVREIRCRGGLLLSTPCVPRRLPTGVQTSTIVAMSSSLAFTRRSSK